MIFVIHNSTITDRGCEFTLPTLIHETVLLKQFQVSKKQFQVSKKQAVALKKKNTKKDFKMT